MFIVRSLAVLLGVSCFCLIQGGVPLSRQKRVIGGSTVRHGENPWLVSLKGKIPIKWILGIIPIQFSEVYCGGSVLDDRWILTAAHCFDGSWEARDPDNWEIRLATTDIEQDAPAADHFMNLLGEIFDRDEWRMWEIDAASIIRHPRYNRDDSWHNDIALVRLEDRVPAGRDFSAIQRIRLPRPGNSSFPAQGDVCTMTGWGCTASGGSISSSAMQVELPVESDRRCMTYYGLTQATGRLCAGFTPSFAGAGICPGDSGGPLVCQNEAGTPIQVGVASFTSQSDPDEYPGVFARVSDYSDWIRRTMARYN